MKAIVKLVILLVLIFNPVKQSTSCTIFFIKGDGIVLAGNNEDWQDPECMMFFYPAIEGKYGWVKFGWGSGFPQGGMNEKGLFWDGSSGPYLDMPESEAGKTKLETPIMQQVIEACADVEEARVVFDNYYCEDQYKAQYLIGDAVGTSVIVEGDYVRKSEGNYQVLTNFIQSYPAMGGYPCWRHSKVTELLGAALNVDCSLVGQVLASTHQEGKYPTQYSQIYDLKKKQIYLFYFHNYDEFIKIDMAKELKKGYRSFKIPELFSQVSNLHPANGTSVNSGVVTFSWDGLLESEYRVVCSEDPAFEDYEVGYYLTNRLETRFSFKNFAVILFLPFFLFMSRFKKIVLLVLMVPFLLVSCENEDELSHSAKTINHTKELSGFQSGKTYYWKIEADVFEGAEFKTETVVRQFFVKY